MDSQITNSSDLLRIITFGEFSFDAEKRILWRGGETVQLAPKACELLDVLIENAPQVLSKEELMNLVWADSFVEEANLTHHISALRKALGEDKNGRKFIETIPRKGYRFVAEVKHAANIETAEIIVSERTSMKVVEETTVEANDFPDDAEIIRATDDVTSLAAPPLRNLTGRNRRSVWMFAAVIVLLLGTTAFFGWRYFGASNNASAVTPEISFKRLTPDADASAPSISPDGLSIVFVKNENGQQSLWRKQIASGEMTQLTPAVSMLNEGFGVTRFSPDGRWIYYTYVFADDIEKTQSIYRFPAGGGKAQKILSGLVNDFSISPDGKQIAYTFDWRQLIIADIETGNKRVVAERDGVKEAIITDRNSVAWSPDGTHLIFPIAIVDGRYVMRLIELNLTTGTEKQIPNKSGRRTDQIEWLSDDSGLIVTQDSQIWQLDYRTGAEKRISNEPDKFYNLRISADSKTLVAQQALGQFNIWTAPADNIDKRRQITIGAAAKHGVLGLALMPDGKILYSSTEGGADDIWIMNADGGERRNLTAGSKTSNTSPQPTADGRYIVFSSNRSGTMQVWRIDADGSNPVQLSKGSENWSISISPENEIYYMSFLAAEQKYQIYKVSIEGGEPVRIDDYYSEEVPIFSPDGKWILFFGGKTKDEKPRVGIIERTSGKIVRYFDNAFQSRGWMPDSKAIVDTMAHGTQLWKQPIDGGAPEKIYDLSPLKISRWEFSADGKKVVFSLGNSTSEIVAIQNFSGAIK